MNDWNLDEFKMKCLEVNRLEAYDYVNSINFKLWAALYHRDNFESKFNELKDKSPAFFLSIDTSKLEWEIAFEVDGYLACLNSVWDLIGQMINVLFIIPPLPEHKLYFERLLNVKRNMLPETIITLTDKLLKEPKYQLLKNLVNTSKHRSAIEGKLTMIIGDWPWEITYETRCIKQNSKLEGTDMNKLIELFSFVRNNVVEIGKEVQRQLG